MRHLGNNHHRGTWLLLLLQLALYWQPAAASRVEVGTNGAVLTETSPQTFVPAVKSSLTVQIPAALHNPKGEGHRLAHFGNTGFRGSMARYTYYVSGNLCNPETLQSGNFTYPKGNGTSSSNPIVIHPFFLLAHNSDDCTPVRMARNAQEFGASALILGDAWCRCADADCRNAFPNDKDHCEETDPPLVDDGSAGDVTIPTVLLHKLKAEALYKSFTANPDQPALLELAWGLPMTVDDLPEHVQQERIYEPHYHLWTTAHDPLLGAVAYEHFRTLAVAFGRTIHFSPRFALQNGAHFGCPQHADVSPDESPCDHLCTHHGRYCAAAPSANISGHAVVRESLRRLCIYEHFPAFTNDTKKKKDKINTAYWDYVIYHIEHCSQGDKYHDDACIQAAYKTAGIDSSKVDGCMQDTGDVDKDAGNTLLEEMLSKQAHGSVKEVPAVTINNRFAVQKPSARTLFTELCTHFWEATHAPVADPSQRVEIKVPSVCETCFACSNTIGCLAAGKCVPWGHHYDDEGGYADDDDKGGKKKKKGGHGWTIFFLLVLLLIAGGAYWYHKKREELFGSGAGGTGLLNDYMQLSSGA